MNAVLQSVLDPAGPQAAHIARLWWLMFWVSSAVFAIVAGFLVAAVARRHRPGAVVSGQSSAGGRQWSVGGGQSSVAGRQPSVGGRQPEDDLPLTRAVAIGVALTVVTLFVLLVARVWTGRSVASLGAASAVTINVTGHQYWWEIEYDDAIPSRRVLTANEIHIPVGHPVVLKGTSRDVIHSFWAPNLHGKRDLIPGITSAIWLEADEAAVYRGQCAEFCGKQHAHMAFEIVAEPEAQFAAWLDAQREPARAPAGEDETRGRDVFMNAQCALCHRIRGTSAHGQIGPDLTHVAARGKIASGTLQNNPAEMARWIRDPQHVKPGNQMPPTVLSDADLQALAAYLESLK
jgi:cytochrome c oxidase subunit 2